MSWMSQFCGENENDYIEVHKKHYNDLIEKSKELEVYKTALEMACGGMGFNYCKNCRLEHSYVNCSGCKTKEDGWVDFYLDMARKEV